MIHDYQMHKLVHKNQFKVPHNPGKKNNKIALKFQEKKIDRLISRVN